MARLECFPNTEQTHPYTHTQSEKSHSRIVYGNICELLNGLITSNKAGPTPTHNSSGSSQWTSLTSINFSGLRLSYDLSHFRFRDDSQGILSLAIYNHTHTRYFD